MQDAEYQKMYEAEDTHWWYASLHDLILRSLPKASRNRLRIFDAGCGTGRLLQLMADRGEIHGCDISDLSVKYCRARGLAVEQDNLNAADLRQCSYDVVTAIDVLYHEWVLDDRRVLKKLYNGLKPGGTLILQVPAYEWVRSDHDKAVLTRRRYTRQQVVAMLNDSGFEIAKATYRVSLLFVPIVIVRIIQRYSGNIDSEVPRSSDVRKHSAGMNALLTAIMRAENILLKSCSLPFGTSIFAVARKPEGPDDRT